MQNNNFLRILPSHSHFIIGIIFLHLLFFGLQCYQKHLLLDDSIEYLNESKNIRSFEVIERSRNDLKGIFYCGNTSSPINFDFYTKRPPLYPLFLTLASFFSTNLLLVILFQQFISIFNLYFIRKIAIQLGYKKDKDWLFLCLLLLSPSQFIYSNLIMSEVIFQFFLLLLVHECILFIQFYNLKSIIRFSLFLIAAILTKPVLYLFTIPAFLLFVFFAWKNKKPIYLFPALMPFLFILLYQYWNYERTGVFHYSSIQTINLVHYNMYFFQLNQKGENAANLWLDATEAAANRIKSYPEKTNFLQEEASKVLKEKPISYLLFHIKGVFRFFIDPGRFDIVQFLGIEDNKASGILHELNKGGWQNAFSLLLKNGWGLLFALLLISIGNLIKIGLFIRFLFQQNISLLIRLFLALLVFYIAFMTGPLGASRFAMPLLPILLGFGMVTAHTQSQNTSHTPQ